MLFRRGKTIDIENHVRNLNFDLKRLGYELECCRRSKAVLENMVKSHAILEQDLRSTINNQIYRISNLDDTARVMCRNNKYLTMAVKLLSEENERLKKAEK